MNEMLFSMGISLVLSAIKESVKNPENKEKLKRALLKVFNAIKALYADDPDFSC